MLPSSSKYGLVLLTLVGVLLAFAGCDRKRAENRVTLWHQMTVGERQVLHELIDQYEAANPGIEVRALYKETEELRSGFQAAAQAGAGPELVFGPSDSLGAFVTMGIVQDMRPWFSDAELDQFVDQALTLLPSANRGNTELVQVGDRVGNHLALVYNRNLIQEPPKTTDEFIKAALEATVDSNNDGKPERYGVVWNFVEPFFVIPFLTGHGAWIFEDGKPVPNLDTKECAAGLKFVADLQQIHKVIPAGCDYETADALFKNGSAAMIINGDWSWAEYLASNEIDAAIAPLPIVSSTGKPMGPMVATKGYSLNVFASEEQANLAMDFVKFMTSEATQAKVTAQLKTLPSRKKLLNDPVLMADPTIAASVEQMKNGKPMPVFPEMRAVWDSMRPSYQALLGGELSSSEAAAEMQRESLRKIEVMNREIEPGLASLMLKLFSLIAVLGLLFWQRKSFVRFLREFQDNRFAYCLVVPSLLVLFLTIVYPFFYNVVLSFSNMSLKHFRDWDVIGFQNYAQIFTEETFFWVLLKTLIWTVVCVFFHVAIGLLLAICLNGPVRGKSIYRIVLILPWAIPAYITALTWRGMFDFEYGAVNLIANQWLSLPAVNWLGSEWPALVACIVANVWLGFPFMMVIALGGMQGIPNEMYEAARIDRVPRWKQFWHITLPMLKPVLLPAVTLGTIWTFNNLNVVWLVSNAGEPADKTHILVSYVYKAVFNLYQYGYGAAFSMVIFFMLLVFSLAFLWRTKATEAVA